LAKSDAMVERHRCQARGTTDYALDASLPQILSVSLPGVVDGLSGRMYTAHFSFSFAD
jgi:hypothetical protein